MSIPDEIKSFIKESGNSFHCQVTKYLRERGWSTLVSPYYMDGSTNKPREIDLIAENHWEFPPNRLNDKPGAVIIRLFIECKYIPQPNVFWFSDKDKAAAENWLVSNTPFKRGNSKMERHHYLASDPRVAKLFASINKPITENEAMYRALNQSLNAMVNLRGGKSIIPRIREREIPKTTFIEMPVVLCNSFDKFYRVEMETPEDPRKLVENFQLEINYAYLDIDGKRRNDYFLVDIVDFNEIDSFLKVLEVDKDAIVGIL